MTETDRPKAAACFILASNLLEDRGEPVRGLKMIDACERSIGERGRAIDGAQKIGGLWRIYPLSNPGRRQRLLNGVTIRGQSVAVHGNNPKATGGDDNSVKLYISNLPLSIATSEVIKSLDSLGVVRLSAVKYDCYRNQGRGLTQYKSGKRFVFIKKPTSPLPKSTLLGEWRMFLFYRDAEYEEAPHAQQKVPTQETSRLKNDAPRGAWGPSHVEPVSIWNSLPIPPEVLPVVVGMAEPEDFNLPLNPQHEREENADDPPRPSVDDEVTGDKSGPTSGEFLYPRARCSLHPTEDLRDDEQVVVHSESQDPPSEADRGSVEEEDPRPSGKLKQSNIKSYVNDRSRAPSRPGNKPRSQSQSVSASPHRGKRALSGEAPSPQGKAARKQNNRSHSSLKGETNKTSSQTSLGASVK